ncbi:GH36-type glycosyl hydrolase domain-containing protein [Anaeromicropila herbilytica]|uniref:N,N'-diacetylchitobiose phosphorylase n=1 Tax=Anaeromicropila herbilytica TaxID=2785025 RepID=A0A7R7IB74_9FIRM|nr:cellobiose phosphorylase [Anaeromicropila herbilytica]BCN29268.1 N,N'-diacetylchitobiose phosphorylase [Anaeromicropila herbilytica]
MESINFLNNEGTFSVRQAENYSHLYFPIAGEEGIKSSLSPNLGGDSKLNQNSFVIEPVSAENLHNNRSGRNFWCNVDGCGSWSVVGVSAEEECRKFTKEQDDSELTAGFMWQTVTRTSQKYQLSAKVTSFVPLKHNVEIMQVEIRNNSNQQQVITPIAAIPLYGRSADNIRDHRHVTSLLHRITTTDYGVMVKPTMSFDERGHKENHMIYYVCGISGNSEKPQSFYPIVEEYIGEGGSFTHPQAVICNKSGENAGRYYEGKEAIGGIRFETVTLKAGESTSYTILLGATDSSEEITELIQKCNKDEKVKVMFNEMKEYWQSKVNVRFYTGNNGFDSYMRWVSFQPILRRIYGCSFLPYHDYGKGGRGWRDLWQDCLALLIMDPTNVRQMILDNYGGVRIDGTNATIIGEKQGEFIADRNNITRVWMDHGVWPFITTKLYIDQTGDIGILNQDVSYFKDQQIERGFGKDIRWKEKYGNVQKDIKGKTYSGSVLEHLLLQHLCAFYEVGEHNHIKLRGADWNDALDMAEKHGESVAFTCAYAGNMKEIALYMKKMKDILNISTVELLVEMRMLLQDDIEIYENIMEKQELLHNYTILCRHNITGKKVKIDIDSIVSSLEHKADWLMQNIRKHEWIKDLDGNGWFNSYYDNDGKPVEGVLNNGVRMMLTGQVFAIMSETAQKEQVSAICKSADRYLYEKEIGGYRLNTDFHEQKFNLGRMFGFAYGEKENGAVFSHMTVMYANALYRRGFVKEGYKALQTLADTALNFETSRIYPGIPEYFNSKGRGMYHYLTGAASWYMITMLTEVFGVRGETGELVIRPKLVREQFDKEGRASVQLLFADKNFIIEFYNPNGHTYGEYQIKRAVCDNNTALYNSGMQVCLSRKKIIEMDNSIHKIIVELK